MASKLKLKNNQGDTLTIENSDVSSARGDLTIDAGKVYNRVNDVVSVKDFGAVGDGVTDDTAAIQAAIDFAEAKVVAQPDASGDPINGATVFFDGVFKISEPLRVAKGNIALQGNQGATILPYYTDSTGYNGAKPVFIVGNAEDWQTSGAITGAIKYNKIDGFKVVRTSGYLSFIGVLVSGTRNATVSNCLFEAGYCGVYLENSSEFYSEQVSTIGCTYGCIADNRGNRPATDSVLNVANTDNDVSSITFKTFTMYYPQHTGFLAINTGTINLDSCTVGRFSENPDGTPSLGLPTASAGVHVWGANSKWTRSMMMNNLVFEPTPTMSLDCVRLESDTANNPVIGCTLNNCHVQTFAAEQETGGAITTLLRLDQSGSGDLRHIVMRDSGFTYQSSGYYYGDLVHSSGSADLYLSNCYPTVAYATSTFPNTTVFDPIKYLEEVNLDAFPPTGWTAIGTTTGCSKAGDSSGTPAYLNFTGDTGAMSIYKRFTVRNTKQDLKTVFISFMIRGDADMQLQSRINGWTASGTQVIDGTTKGMYGQALFTDKSLDSSTWRRVVWIIKPNSVNYGFDNLDFWVGRAADASSSSYAQVRDIKVGYFQGLGETLNPF